MTVTEPSVQPKKRGRPKGSKNTPKAEVKPAPHDESPEQRRARLLAELAELEGGRPSSSGGPLGPNYWSMNHSALKALCVSKAIIDRTGTKEGMIQQLQAEDAKSGLQPHPRENEQVMSGLRAGNTLVHAEPQNRDSTRIIDQDGNQLAMVYRVVRQVNGQPVLADMEGNARKIVAALNEGRF